MEVPINILIVDDEPKNLTVLETVLANPGYRLVRAESADKALLALVAEEFALLILDVRMPEMTGFELAQIIKQRTKTAHIPIIFLTAYYNEVEHVFEGYGVGAVDYLHKPVNATVLRSKVAVFAEQQRRQRALVAEVAERRRAEEQLRELNETLDQRVVERSQALLESELRYREMLDALPAAIYTTDAHGRVAHYNAAAVAASGRNPVIGKDEWCVAWKLFNADGTPLASNEYPMAITMNEGRDMRGHQLIIERPDGSRFWGEVYPSRLRNSTGEVVGGINMIIDITDRKGTEAALRQSEERFRTFADTAPAMLWVTDTDGMCTFLSGGWYEYTGLTEKESLGLGWTNAIHPDDRNQTGRFFLAANVARDSHFAIEYRLKRADGEYRWALDIGRPRFSPSGVFLGYVGNVLDVDEQKRMVDELARHRAHLQQMVDERTAELEASHRQLRLSERMAALGTLSAGLGHDMGNLLLPVRVRLDSLAKADLSESARKDVEAIQTSAEYLRKLSTGLRLLALDPGQSTVREATELGSWWEEAKPMLRNVLPRGVVLESTVPEERIWAAISRPAITQAVFNLVQNAGDAMRTVGSGTVTVSIEKRGDAVLVSVTDNGTGMSAEVKGRCMEPFFTTKPREISTGLGLALVYGLVHEAKGSIAIHTAPGQGTTFAISLPVTDARSTSSELSQQAGRTAAVNLNEPRLRAFVTAELQSLGFNMEIDVSMQADLVVVDDLAKIEAGSHGRSIILIGSSAGMEPNGVIVMGEKPSLQTVREVLRKAAEKGLAVG